MIFIFGSVVFWPWVVFYLIQIKKFLWKTISWETHQIIFIQEISPFPNHIPFNFLKKYLSLVYYNWLYIYHAIIKIIMIHLSNKSHTCVCIFHMYTMSKYYLLTVHWDIDTIFFLSLKIDLFLKYKYNKKRYKRTSFIHHQLMYLYYICIACILCL